MQISPSGYSEKLLIHKSAECICCMRTLQGVKEGLAISLVELNSSQNLWKQPYKDMTVHGLLSVEL